MADSFPFFTALYTLTACPADWNYLLNTCWMSSCCARSNRAVTHSSMYAATAATTATALSHCLHYTACESKQRGEA
eukprot:5389-Heterococcus_DN1.PRE.1